MEGSVEEALSLLVAGTSHRRFPERQRLQKPSDGATERFYAPDTLGFKPSGETFGELG